MHFFLSLSRRLRRLLSRVYRLRVIVDTGQTTAEYSLVLIFAGAVALAAILWVRRSDSIGQLFESVFQQLVSSVA